MPISAIVHTSAVAGSQGVGGSTPCQAVRLSSTFSPLPAKLATKIRSGQFVEMKELLADNMALQHQLDAIQAQPAFPLPVTARPRMRDIESTLVWAYCFLAYAAAVDPVMRNLLTYGQLIAQESQRHGGTGWLEYDKVFHQQAALNGSLPWNELSSSLFASTILSARAGPGLFCTLCQEADHLAPQCALAFLQAPLLCSRPARQDLGVQALITQPLPLPSPDSQLGSRRIIRPETLERICVSWNRAAVSSRVPVNSAMCMQPAVSVATWHGSAPRPQRAPPTRPEGGQPSTPEGSTLKPSP